MTAEEYNNSIFDCIPNNLNSEDTLRRVQSSLQPLYKYPHMPVWPFFVCNRTLYLPMAHLFLVSIRETWLYYRFAWD